MGAGQLMGVSVRKNFKPLAQLKLTTKAVMKEVGLLARERIVRRTLAGTDAAGAPFRRYSPGYAKRKARELGAGPVNLQVSGQMLNAIQITELTDDSVTLGFTR